MAWTILRGAAAAAALAATAAPALAHHGWSWTSGGNIELTGVVREARLGNPHGELTVQAGDETWTVEVGQPWRNDRAGVTDAMLAPGREITAVGEPAADGARLMKAERLIIDGTLHELYPGRD